MTKYRLPLFALIFLFNGTALLAHSGGLNKNGCHEGSQPYHCQRSQSNGAATENAPQTREATPRRQPVQRQPIQRTPTTQAPTIRTPETYQSAPTTQAPTTRIPQTFQRAPASQAPITRTPQSYQGAPTRSTVADVI